MKRAFCILLISTSIVIAKAQIVNFTWFPDTTLFPSLHYDLLENHFYTGSFILSSQSVDYSGAYIPVNIGIQKAFMQWKISNTKFQFSLGAASFTQFEIIRFDANTLRGGLLNNDYKASGIISASNEQHKFKLQLFHISSHLGDDYMLRNEYFELNDKTVNYEQIDVIYFHELNKISPYGGFGYVVSPNTFRKRFMMQFGLQGVSPLTKNLSLAFGSDIKLYEEHNYKPNIHTSFGFNVNKGKPHLNFSIDTYYGKIPYSTLKMGNVFWYGLSTIINI